MATTADYLTQLQADKQTLVDNLVAKGVEATSDETFTTLAPKVADIQSGGGDIEITDASYLFYYGARTDYINELCSMISPNCENYSYMFSNCSNEIEISNFNTSKASNVRNMFASANGIVNVPLLDFSSVTNITNIFYTLGSNIHLTTLGGFKDLGKSYLTTQSANYSYYKLDLSKLILLTHDSLMNVINNLYDIATAGVQAQDLVLGETNLAKLTDEEVSVAVNKGWNVS